MQAVQGVIDREDLAAADKQMQAKADVEALKMVVEGVTSFNESCGKGQNDTGHMLNHLPVQFLLLLSV